MVEQRGKARFVLSHTTWSGLPDLALPELAFVGRSNVGKSSLLGRLLNDPRLVRTSRTPGRTQLLNLFVYENRMALVDLPGYGYARLSKSKRSALGTMTSEYLQRRGPLRGVVQIVDARRDPVVAQDREVAEWLLEIGRPLLLAITKADLVPKNRLLGRVRTIEKQLGVPPASTVVVSAKTGQGRDELFKRLDEVVAASSDAAGAGSSP